MRFYKLKRERKVEDEYDVLVMENPLYDYLLSYADREGIKNLKHIMISFTTNGITSVIDYKIIPERELETEKNTSNVTVTERWKI